MKSFDFILYGGCVTRDAFEVSNRLRDEARIVRYFSRSIPASYITKPFDFIGDLSGYGEFEKRVIHEDAQKAVIKFLQNPLKFDCMVCDFISSARLDLYELECGGIGTLTPQVAKILKNKFKFSRIKRSSDNYHRYHKSGIDSFILFIKKNINKSIILINKVYFSNKNNNGLNGNYQISDYNNVLDDIYSKIEKEIDRDIFLNYNNDELICDVNHKWSPAPFHYVKDFYVSQAQQILERLDSRPTRSGSD